MAKKKDDRRVSDINFAVYLGDHGDVNLRETLEAAQEAIRKIRAQAKLARRNREPRRPTLSQFEEDALEALIEGVDQYIGEISQFENEEDV